MRFLPLLLTTNAFAQTPIEGTVLSEIFKGRYCLLIKTQETFFPVKKLKITHFYYKFIVSEMIDPRFFYKELFC